MSRIDELVAEHCPEGVRYSRVDSAVAVVPTGRGIQRSEYAAGTLIPVVDQGLALVAGYTDDLDLALPEGQYIVFGDHTRKVKWVDFRFACGADGTKVLRAEGGSLSKYLYYALSNLAIASRGYNRHWAILRERLIPVPPLEVQREIVRILDQFTQLEAELEAELEARRRQYAHYRDSLLTLREGVRWIPMGEIGTFIRGRRFTKADVVPDGIPSIHYGEIYTHYGVSAHDVLRHVRSELADQLRYAEHGDVIVASVGETVDDVGKGVAWLGDGPVAIHDDTFRFRHEMNPKFVSYFLQTEAFHSQKAPYVARAKVKRLSGESLAKITMPMPSRQEQDRLVATLDTFDALVNDLRVGIPAELAARRRQYEYYRDRLLTFTELGT